ncbi:hypothetical protein [Xanthobacter tagetidis]|uniref:Uncharacterized protein n=1 Tax=Xanthobacter tagetidis TaxID=60216 RepID=A0A3L7A4A8_9HYPH|nr:hypothetical protein [Xanthobacter tagetidis]MBB6310025.1 hypothetical protein [Xanthobacter tagetidis]RLP75129.1 hypothetical protein D9R14_17265 [Xanthobacter tagetidis]
MGQSSKTGNRPATESEAGQAKLRHGAGHTIGNYQESGRRHEDGEGDAKAPGHLVGNHQDDDEPGPAGRRSRNALGRPDTNEDKDMNVEQLKSRARGREAAASKVGQPDHSLEAERIDPTGRRAGERE